MSGFNADEVFELAEELERNGADFYRDAAAYADGEEQELLQRLAVMEEEHEKVFHRLRREQSEQINLDPEGVGARYLRSLMKGQVFDPAVTHKVAGSESIGDLLDRAIGFEKEAIVFFTCLRRAVTEEKSREALDRLIGEEVGHIADLQEQKTRLPG